MPMTIIDKIKTATWFRLISMHIKASDWPPEERPEIEARVKRYLQTVAGLENEARLEMEALESC